MKPIFILSIMDLVALLLPWVLVSCDRRRLDVGPKEEAPLAVKVEAVDGIRTIERVLRSPSLAVTVVNGGDQATYEAVFSVNGGPERTVRSIWNGVLKDLSGELLGLDGYGPIDIKGYLYDTAVLTERIPLDTTVWMAYAPATRGALLVSTPRREEPVGNGTVLEVGESGTLELRYTPEDTFLHVGLSVPEGSPLSLNGRSAVNLNGRFSVPFSVRESGETVITLTTANGRDVQAEEYAVVCKQPAQNDNN